MNRPNALLIDAHNLGNRIAYGHPGVKTPHCFSIAAYMALC